MRGDHVLASLAIEPPRGLFVHVIGTLLSAGLDFEVPPLPDPLEFVSLQALLGEASSITTDCVFSGCTLRSSTIPFSELADFAFEFSPRALKVCFFAQPSKSALFLLSKCRSTTENIYRCFPALLAKPTLSVSERGAVGGSCRCRRSCRCGAAAAEL